MSEEMKRPKGAAAENPLGYEKINGLMFRFAVPSIVAMLVSAIYNIVDQFFIGRAVGTLGNAATNVAFPLNILCTSIALLFGIGGASNFNLNLGRGRKEKALYYIGNAVTMIIFCSLVIMTITELFLPGLLHAFGSPEDVLPYAITYVRITAVGFPFVILTMSGGHLMRADGSPKMTMICCLSGAIINTFLDALFVLVLGWGMAGAAVATVAGQMFSGIMFLIYLTRFKTAPLKKEHFLPQIPILVEIVKIGMASCINQLAMMVVQITINNSLRYYGALSIYGEAAPIAVAGIINKLNMIFFSIVIGLGQGSQPIISFNYGARQYRRVKDAYKTALSVAFAISAFSFLLYQFIPRQLIAIFGEGSEAYFDFGIRYFRIYLFFTFANCIQPVSSTLFTSIGKAVKGTFLSLTRQILFLLPMILLLPRFLGIAGILYAGPVADFVAAVTGVTMVVYEFRNMSALEKNGANI